MADNPVIKPPDAESVAAAPVATPAPSPESAVSAPVTPAPVDDAVFTVDTPIDYADDAGNPMTDTLGDLIAAKQQLAALGGVDKLAQAKDIMGALDNDPEATKRLLEAQLSSLTPAPVVAPENEEILKLRQDYDTLSKRMVGSDRLVQQAEDAQMAVHLKTILANEKVATGVPWLAARPDIGIPVLQKSLKALQIAAGVTNEQLSQRTDLLGQAMRQADNLIQSIAKPYGGMLPAAPADPKTVAENTEVIPAGTVRKAAQTPQDLLAGFNKTQVTHAGLNPGAAGNVLPEGIPESGGVVGGQPVGAEEQKGTFNRAQGLARLKQQRAERMGGQ